MACFLAELPSKKRQHPAVGSVSDFVPEGELDDQFFDDEGGGAGGAADHRDENRFGMSCFINELLVICYYFC